MTSPSDEEIALILDYMPVSLRDQFDRRGKNSLYEGTVAHYLVEAVWQVASEKQQES